MSEEKSGWKSVELPEEIVAQAEELMRVKHEGRLTKVPIGLFISDLIREGIEREHVTREYQSLLEVYAIEPDCVYVRDNKRNVITELRFKDEADLYCNIDAAKNCVHIGFAWSIPKVNLLIATQKSRAQTK